MKKNVVDISKYICNDKAELTLFGKTYGVKSDRASLLAYYDLMRKLDNSASDADLQILKVLMDEKEAEELWDVLSGLDNYAQNERIVMINVLALATGESVETLEARFQRNTKG